MTRALLCSALLSLGLVACASDDTGPLGYGTATNKPVPHPVPSGQVHTFVESASTASDCGDCTILHEVSDAGEQLTFLDGEGNVICAQTLRLDRSVASDTCGTIPFETRE